MNEKNKNVLIIVLSAVALLTVFTVTYAYFVVSPTINGQKQTSVIETGTLQLTFDDNDSGVAGTLHFGDSIEKKFVITNTGSIDVYANIQWLELTNTYLEGSLVYDLYYSDTYSATNVGYTQIGSTTNVPKNQTGTTLTTTLMDGLLVPADNTTGSATYHNKTRYYTLRITLVDSPTVNQTADINATFNTKFTLVEGSAPSSPIKYLAANGDEMAKPATLELGQRIAIGDQVFRYISTTNGNVRMLAEYNLNVGDYINSNVEEGIQDSSIRGYVEDCEGTTYCNEDVQYYGTVAFSNDSTEYTGSILEDYINQYVTKLSTEYNIVLTGDAITHDELVNTFNCSEDDYNCPGTVDGKDTSWIYTTSYWSGSALNDSYVWGVSSLASFFGGGSYGNDDGLGVRPVIVISESLI